MTAKCHGTRQRYNEGCRCDECKAAQRAYQRRYRERKANGLTRPVAVVTMSPPVADATPGPVELGVQAEIDGLAAQARPGLAAAAICLAQLLDNPRAVSQHPSAAKVMVQLLDQVAKAGAPARRTGLSVVRDMTKKG
jgi:hypothetical protein